MNIDKTKQLYVCWSKREQDLMFSFIVILSINVLTICGCLGYVWYKSKRNR